MYNNPYMMYQPRIQQIDQVPQQPIQQLPQMQQPFIQTLQNTQPTLLGKQVESVEVVKATEVPFDGSVSYFPLSDGSAIITKKIQQDGTSKMVVYKPVTENKKEEPKYVTVQELEKAIRDIDLSEISDLKNDFKDIEKRLKDIENSKRR